MQLRKALLGIATCLMPSADLLLQHRQTEDAFSPPVYPSPWMDPEAEGWEDAYAKAKDFVSQLTLLEKVNLTTGVG